LLNTLERLAQVPFLIIGGNNYRDYHRLSGTLIYASC
jgi:hypothetical protein